MVIQTVSDDPRFASLEARIANREELRPIMTGIFADSAAKMTIADAKQILAENEVPFGIVRKLEELVDDKQVMHNGTFRYVDHPVAGRLIEAIPAPRFKGTPLEQTGPAPTVGQHTEEIMQELGMGADYQTLKEQGVVS